MHWISIWSSSFFLEAEQARDLLTSHAIPAHILDQKDSAYVVLGEVKVMIPSNFEEDARRVLTINGFLSDQAVMN